MNNAARILVVDDEAVVLHTLEIILRRQGYEVWTAADSHQAQVLLHTCAFDLLLFDLKLPGGVNGLELAQGARAFQSDAAIMILTGSDEFATIVGDAALPYFEIMHKTASPQEVLDRVAALLAQKRKPAAPIR